jgi:LCP family protein required for cell wall assembly
VTGNDIVQAFEALARRGRREGSNAVVGRAMSMAGRVVGDAPSTTPTAPEIHRRRWPRRLLIGTSIAVAVCVVGAGWGYIQWRHGQIRRLAVGHVAPDKGTVMNVLLVGSDSRDNLTGTDAKQAGKGLVFGQRSDTLMILHIDTSEKKAAILSIPRDLNVLIAGTNRRDRINAAFEDPAGHGADRLVQTVHDALGITVNHYMEVDFVGFKGIVDTVGGVSLYVPTPARDAYSGLNIKLPGCIHFNGEMGLQWVRSRHYQYYEAGRWHEDPRADLGRIPRQQEFIRRVLKKAVSSGLTNPVRLNSLVADGVKYVTIDNTLSTPDMLKIAKKFRTLNPDTVDMETLKTEALIQRGQYAGEKLVQPEAQAQINRINGVKFSGAGQAPPSGISPSQVRVTVRNGTGAPGLATRVGTALSGAGFEVAFKGDADNFRYNRTVIRYAPQTLAKAQVLQNYLVSGANLVADTTLKTVDVAVIVGSDYNGVKAAPAAAGSATTSKPTGTTVPPTTTTPSTVAAIPGGAKGAPATPSC